MTDRHRDAPSLASVAFIRIDGYARLPVAEQAQRKAELEALLADLAGAMAQDRRIVLEAPDGQALVVLDSPGAALQAAQRALAGTAGPGLCIGLNHGPVLAAPAAQGEVQALLGDGLQAAGTAAGFAGAGGLMATRAFRQALAAQAPQRARGLVAAGSFTDAKVRSHEMFAYDPRASGKRRRLLLLAGAVGVVAILALGYGARLWRLEQIRLAQPAVLVFEVTPYGDIFIDGVAKGRTPPMERVELKAGAYKIELRYGSQPPLQRELDLQPGQTSTIAHRFYVAPKPPPPKPASAAKPAPSQEQPGFWGRLKKKLGGDK